MGKKDKKKKGLGKAKTEAKVAKKAEKANKKARAADGEDVEAILAEILEKEAALVAVAEHTDVEPPSPRAAFTLVANPINDSELIMFGGERFTGDRATFYNDLFVLNVDKRTWTRYDSPTRPPPRSSHAAAVYKSHMYIFGGEFSNPSLSQYRHYRDVWRLDVTDMSWERIDIRGGPTARSGHRMCVVCGKLTVFGGFYDNGLENKYLNDMSFIDLTADELKWSKVETSAVDIVPSARSGFQWVVTGNEAWLYGGYCRESVAKGKAASHKGKKKGGDAMIEEALVAKGVVLSDAFRLDGESMKWNKVKRSGYGPSRRAGFSMVLHKKNAVVFGGVEDDESEEELESTFYNDLFALSLDRKKWFPMTLRKKKGKKGRRRRRKGTGGNGDGAGPSTEIGNDDQLANQEEDGNEGDGEDEDEDEDDDGQEEIDTAKLEAELEAALMEKEEVEAMPCPRFNSAVAVQKNVLYIVGGMIEKADAEVTLDDIWAVDLNKLDEFVEVKAMSKECMEWVASDEEEDDEDDNEERDDDVDMGENEYDDDDDDEEERKRKRGGRRDVLRERVLNSQEENMTPKINESLKDFFDRSKPYWIGEVHEALGESGKHLRRVAFEWAFKRYWEIKPTLKELEELEAELAHEAELEEEFSKAQITERRGRSRR